MLPMDLEYPSPTQLGHFTFDWRNYLCTMFDQMRETVRYQSTEDMPGIDLVSVTNLPQMASDLHEKYNNSGSPESFRHKILPRLIEAAKTIEVGIDGRLTELRQQRRGLFHGSCYNGRQYDDPHEGCVYTHELQPRSSDRYTRDFERYKRHDQQHVVEKLLKYQEAAASQRKLWNI